MGEMTRQDPSKAAFPQIGASTACGHRPAPVLTRANGSRKGQAASPPGRLRGPGKRRSGPGGGVKRGSSKKSRRTSKGPVCKTWQRLGLGAETAKREYLSAASLLNNLRRLPGEQNGLTPPPQTSIRICNPEVRCFRYIWEPSLSITVSCSITSASSDPSPLLC